MPAVATASSARADDSDRTVSTSASAEDTEVDALAERAGEAADDRLGGSDEGRVARACGDAEERPAEAVGPGARIAVDEAVLVERPQRARDLALVLAEELGEAQDAEAAGRARLVGVEGLEDAEPATEAGCGICNHCCSIRTTIGRRRARSR